MTMRPPGPSGVFGEVPENRGGDLFDAAFGIGDPVRVRRFLPAMRLFLAGSGRRSSGMISWRFSIGFRAGVPAGSGWPADVIGAFLSLLVRAVCAAVAGGAVGVDTRRRRGR